MAVPGLRTDTGGWSVNCGALFSEASTKCSLANYYSLDIIKYPFINPTYQYNSL